MQIHRCRDPGYGSQAAPVASHRTALVVLRDAGAAFDSVLVEPSGPPSGPDLQRHGEKDMSPTGCTSLHPKIAYQPYLVPLASSSTGSSTISLYGSALGSISEVLPTLVLAALISLAAGLLAKQPEMLRHAWQKQASRRLPAFQGLREQVGEKRERERPRRQSEQRAQTADSRARVPNPEAPPNHEARTCWLQCCSRPACASQSH